MHKHSMLVLTYDEYPKPVETVRAGVGTTAEIYES